MSVVEKKRERLLNLIAVLMDAKEPVTFRSIRERVVGYDDAAQEDAKEKRFERDKKELRDLGIEVEYVDDHRGTAGYVIRSECIVQREMQFTNEDVLLLSMAARGGEAATGGGLLARSLKSALRKLAVDLPDGAESRELTNLLQLGSATTRTAECEVLTTLVGAVARSCKVRFVYWPLAGEKSEREVEPYGLGMVRGAWYLVGRCLRQQGIRTFKLARIQGEVRLSSAHAEREFECPVDFTLARYLQDEGWDLGEREPVTVRLKVAAGSATPQLPARAMEIARDGSGVIYELSVRRPEQIVPWILARAGAVSVEAPVELREVVRETAQRLLARDARPVEQPQLVSVDEA
jgi:proteasome accessory factor B